MGTRGALSQRRRSCDFDGRVGLETFGRPPVTAWMRSIANQLLLD